MSEDDGDELKQLKSNADNLSRCLHVLLEKIERIEQKTSTNGGEASPPADTRYEQADVQESTSVDANCVKRKTIVTERVLTTKTFRSLAIDGPSPTWSPMRETDNARDDSRILTVDAKCFQNINVEKRGTQLVVISNNNNQVEMANHLRPGDVIRTINNKKVMIRADLENHQGMVELCVEPIAVHLAPSLFYRCTSAIDDAITSSALPIQLHAGDVLQVLSASSDGWSMCRKMGDLESVGAVPSDWLADQQRLAMMSPFGRRCLVLLGHPAAGRSEIKSMLLRYAPHFFSTVVPLTSRAPKPNEVEGVDYRFVRKEDMYRMIRDKQLVEWGELDHQIYGTCKQSVRDEIRAGRMCVLDAAPQSLHQLYNAEFMPFVVHISSPPLDEFIELEALKSTHRTREQLNSIFESSQRTQAECRTRIDLTLINRNIDVTFKRLIDALELLRYETQWVPSEWLEQSR